MPDPETFKTILNGGSFALLSVFILWVLFRAWPQYQQLVERINDKWAATVAAAITDHKKTIAEMQREFREERRELMGLRSAGSKEMPKL